MAEQTASRRLLSGASWIYGAQAATVIVQFGYAAVTSRAVAPDGFGAYSVALAVTALIVLVANGGLAQTVARMVELDVAVIRSLVTYALLLGTAAAAVLLLTAPLWAALWGVPQATTPIRWLAINTLTAPVIGIATGYTRRIGRFRRLAITVLVANLAGMALGVLAVLAFRTASALLVSVIVSQTVVLVVCVALSGGVLARPGGLRAATGELGFSAKVVASTVLAYLAGNVGKWGVATGIGPAALGQWNRAEILSLVPFQYVQDAMTQAIYPEFRHDRASAERARRVWTDLLTLTAWVALPAAALAAAVLPAVVPLLLGPGWSAAALITAPLAVLGGLQIVVSLLYNALEAVGRFSSIWAAQALQIGLNGAGAAVAIATRSIVPVLAALLLGLAVQHVLQVRYCRRAGYLDAGRLTRSYAVIAAVAVLVAASARGAVVLLQLQPLGAVWSAAVVVGALLATGALLAAGFGRLPPVVLAARYGLVPARLRRPVRG